MITVYRKDPKRFPSAVFNLTAMLYIAFTMLVMTFYSDTITKHADGGVRIVVYIGGFSFAKLVVIKNKIKSGIIIYK